MKLESFILNDFFDILNDIRADYCVMNNYENMPEIIPSDVDFAIDIKTFQSLDSIISSLAEKHNVAVTQKIWHGYNKCAYILSPLHTDRFFWLQLDFFVDFCAKGYPNLMPIGEMLSNKTKFKNFYIPLPEIEVPFLIQRRIIKGDINNKHLDRILLLYNESPQRVKDSLNLIFGSRATDILLNTILFSDISPFHNNFSFLKRTLKNISKNNSTINYKISYYSNQLIRAFYRLYYPTGLTIGLMGNNLRTIEILAEKVEAIISGSYQGTQTVIVFSYFKYFKQHCSSIYWSIVTKKKVYVYLNLENKNWNKFLKNPIIKLLKLRPTIIIDSESKMKIERESLSNITYQILKLQSERTKRHMNSRLSQTSRNRLKNLEISD
jgi:hypothetical protein